MAAAVDGQCCTTSESALSVAEAWQGTQLNGRQCRLSSLRTWKIDNCKFNWNQFNSSEEKERRADNCSTVHRRIRLFDCLPATHFAFIRSRSISTIQIYSSPVCRAVLLQPLIERLPLSQLHPKQPHRHNWNWPTKRDDGSDGTALVNWTVHCTIEVIQSAIICPVESSRSFFYYHHFNNSMVRWHRQPSNSNASTTKVVAIIITAKIHRHHPV